MKKVYLDELEDTGNELVNYSEKNITDTLQELKNATNNFIWQGPAYNSFIKEYDIKINKLLEMNNSLTSLAKFLLLAKDGYSDANRKIDNAYEELLSDFKRIGK